MNLDTKIITLLNLDNMIGIRKSFTFDQVDRRIEGRVELHRCGGGVGDDHLQTACCCRCRTDRRSMPRLLRC